MRSLYDKEKVEQEHEAQDDKGAYLEGKGQFKHKGPFRRYNGIRKSLRRNRLCDRYARPAVVGLRVDVRSAKGYSPTFLPSYPRWDRMEKRGARQGRRAATAATWARISGSVQ